MLLCTKGSSHRDMGSDRWAPPGLGRDSEVLLPLSVVLTRRLRVQLVAQVPPADNNLEGNRRCR